MIIWLASYPRSGNTFFRVVVNHRYGIKTCSVYDDPLLERIDASSVVGHQKLPASLEHLDAAPETHLVKTHEIAAHHCGPAIYLVRDGRDSVVSFARYEESFGAKSATLLDRARLWASGGRFRHELTRIIDGDSPYGSWADHALGWAKRKDPTVVVRYEDLIADPIGVVDRALAAIGCRAPIQCDSPPPTFAELHQTAPQFFRRGRRGSWQDELPPALHERFWRLQGHGMEHFQYLTDCPKCRKEAA